MANNLVKPGDARATCSFCHLPSLLELLQVGITIYLEPPKAVILLNYNSLKAFWNAPPDQASHLNASSQAFSTVLRSLVVIFCLTLRPSMVLFMLKQYLKSSKLSG